MSAALDYAGVDIRFVDGDETVNIQIKKETMSREVRAPWQRIKKDMTIVTVYYEVPGCAPLTKTGKSSVPFARWQKKWDGKLQQLDNGFIVFLPEMFDRDNIKIP